MGRRTALLALGTAGLIVVGAAGAEGPQLAGTVGPEAVISLADAAGNRVTQLDPGPFELVVTDRSEEHNFHLTGPNVDVSTDVVETGTKTFQLNLQDGVYRFVCDPHASAMRGTFQVGAGSPPPPPPPTTPPPAAASPIRLVVTAGPGATIALRNAAGKLVKRLKPGRYVIVARDRSAAHNVHLTGAGIDRKTTVAFKGDKPWTVTLKKGTLVFRSDPQGAKLRRTVTVA
jgi:plastocyanin